MQIEENKKLFIAVKMRSKRVIHKRKTGSQVVKTSKSKKILTFPQMRANMIIEKECYR